MSAARAGLAAAVSGPGKCEREMRIGRTTWLIEHVWRLHESRGGTVDNNTR